MADRGDHSVVAEAHRAADRVDFGIWIPVILSVSHSSFSHLAFSYPSTIGRNSRKWFSYLCKLGHCGYC